MNWQRLWRFPAVVSWIACGVLLAGLAAALSRCAPKRADAARGRLSQAWMAGLVRLLPLRVQVHGSLPQETALWLSNHVSWVDIVLLGSLAPLHFLSKAEVARWPIIGWLARAAGTLFIERGQGTAGSLNVQLRQLLKSGHSLVIFPEGTTTAGDQVRTFHGRLLGGASEAAVPLQPVAISYRSDGQRDGVAPFIGDDEFTTHLWRLLGSETIEVQIRFLPPQPSLDVSRNQAARAAQQAVAQALGFAGERITSSASSVSRRAA